MEEKISLRRMTDRQRQETRETVEKLTEFGYNARQVAEMTGLTKKQVWYIKEYFLGIQDPDKGKNKPQLPKEPPKAVWVGAFRDEWEGMRQMFGKGSAAG